MWGDGGNQNNNGGHIRRWFRWCRRVGWLGDDGRPLVGGQRETSETPSHLFPILTVFVLYPPFPPLGLAKCKITETVGT